MREEVPRESSEEQGAAQVHRERPEGERTIPPLLHDTVDQVARRRSQRPGEEYSQRDQGGASRFRRASARGQSVAVADPKATAMSPPKRLTAR